MIHCVVVTQGQLAEELVRSSEIIVGETSPLTPLSLAWDATVEASRERMTRAVKQAEERSVLLLVDLFGGTPHRLAAEFWRPGQVEVVTGVNLPMAVYLASPAHLEGDLSDVVERLLERGRQSVRGADEAMARAPRAVSTVSEEPPEPPEPEESS